MKKHLTIFASVILLGTFIWAIAQERPVFSHKLHKEAEIECSTCHDVANSANASDNLLPAMETCYECHDQSMFGSFSYQENVPAIVTRYIARYSHAQHNTLEISCDRCHGKIEESETVAVGKYLPGMAVCVSCHQVSDEPDYCNTCHGKKEDLIPLNHKLASWSSAHGIESQQHLTECTICHTTNSCLECHEGDNLDHKVHPLNYQFNHSIFAQGNKQTCLTCHKEQSSCNTCHREMMVLPKNHGFVNWSNSRKGDGGKHARAAKMDLDNCLSCHADANGDPICAQCHQSK